MQRLFPLDTRIGFWGISLIVTLGWSHFAGSNQAQAQAAEQPAVEQNSVDGVTDAAQPGAEDQAADDAPSSPEALAAYAKAATFQNNAAFDLAADAWQEFLKQFEDDPKATEARYHLGVCYLELKQMDKALPLLDQVLAADKTFARREDAYLNLGWAQYTMAIQGKADQFPLAEATFGKMLEEFPNGEYADQAYFLRGESLYLQGKREQAVQAYQKLVDGFPESEQLANGLYALGVTNQELGKPKEAGVALQRFIEQYGEHPLANEVKMRFAETVLQQEQLAEAEKRFAEVASLSDFQDADHALYRQAFCVARQERFDDAANLFAQMESRFPQSRYIADANMAAARAYFRAEKFAEAATWFEKLANVDGPYSSESAHWRARILMNGKRFEEALQLVDQQLSTARDKNHPFLANLEMDRIDAMYEIPSRRAETIDLYLKFSEQFSQHVLAPQALYNAAFAALEVKEYQRGVDLAAAFIQKYPDHRLLPDVKHVAAECRLQLGDAEGAAKAFDELANSNGSRAESGKWQLRQAIALFMQKDYRKALEQLTKNVGALESEAEQAEGYYLIGMSHFGLQSYGDAKEALEKSLQLDPTWRQADEAMLNLSRTYRKLKQLDQAKQTAEQLIRLFPDSKIIDQAHFRLAEYAYASGNYEEASQGYAKVIEQWGESTYAPYALYGLGWSRVRLEDHRGAADQFGQLLQQFPDHDLAKQTRYARAMSNQQAGQFAVALKDLESYLAQDDLSRRERSDALYVQGLSQSGLKQYDQAIVALNEVLQTDPTYHATEKVLYEVAWAYKSSGDSEKATAAFQELATKFPESSFTSEALYHAAEALYAEGEFTAAAEAYEDARARLASGGEELGEKIRYKLGWARYQQKDYVAAAKAFIDQITHHAEGELVGDAYFMVGECQFKAKQYRDAIQNYAEASKRTLSSEQITTLTYLHAGQSAGQLGEWKISRDWLASLTRKFPQSAYLSQIRFELGVAEQKLGNAAEAQKLFSDVADRATGELSARSRFMLGELFYAQRQYTQAIVEFRKVMFGFDAKVTPQVAPWQAKAGFEAGQCAGVIASQQRSAQQRQQYVELARRFFEYVRTTHPTSDEAKSSVEQLRKYGG